MEATAQYKVPPPEMFDDYDTGGSWVPPPPAKQFNPLTGKVQAIVYSCQAPSAENITFRSDKNGFLMAVVDGFLLETGYQVNKEYLSSAPFPKKNKAGEITGSRNASALGNYLHAMGFVDCRPASAEEYETLVMATAGQSCKVTIDWEAYNSDTQTTIATTWDQFPVAEDGTRQPFIDVDDKRVWARARIRRFVTG